MTTVDGRRNAERMVLQYSDFQSRILAVRGSEAPWFPAAGQMTRE